jgi:DNA-binding Lrp family transcriptional regulator
LHGRLSYNGFLIFESMTKLNNLTGVDATRLDGAYDIIAKINAESTEILTKIIGLDMKKMDRIQSTVTLIVIEEDQQKEESK